MMYIFFFIALVASIQYSVQNPLLNNKLTSCSVQGASNQVQVFITISSITTSTTKQGLVIRHLEVNWFGGQRSSGDNVGVYDEDPVLHPYAEPLSEVDPNHYPSDYFRSSVELPILFFNLSSVSEDTCMGYWAAYKNQNGTLLSSSCLQTQPFWMEDNSRFLSNLTLSEIMIPGSHDSGSFYFHKEVIPVSKYKYAQEETIFNQLMYGIRYFDLRVGYYRKTKEKYFINHNFLRTKHSVNRVLHQVRQFINATKEIVILDFHDFPIGFQTDEIHHQLMNLIANTFKNLIIPYKKKYTIATFSTLWEENKRILISYNNKLRKSFYPNHLWPSIPRAWGNKQHPKDLKLYFEQVFSQPTPKGLWASMAELTPNTRTIILHPETGLRIFADEINRNVTHWFRDLFWHKANIVATDFFMGNNIIGVAIEINKLKGVCSRTVWQY